MRRHYLLCMSLLCFIVSSAHAHEPGSYEMSFDHCLTYHESIQVREVTVEIGFQLKHGVNGQYIEIPIGNTLDFHRTLYDDGFNIVITGWLNTFAVRSGDVDIMLHHRKPVLPWNQYYNDKLPLFFKEVLRTGQFEYIYELNTHRHGHVLLTTDDCDRIIPAGYHYKVNIENPNDLSTCLRR